MKAKELLLTGVLFIIFSSCGGQTQNDVPANVKSAFTQKFSNATNVKWGRENDQEREAEFKMDSKSYAADFDNAGIWVETEYEINENEIPAIVKSTLDKESTGAKINLSEVAETADGISYEFIVGRGEDQTELVIDNSGKLISNELVNPEDENDSED